MMKIVVIFVIVVLYSSSTSLSLLLPSSTSSLSSLSTYYRHHLLGQSSIPSLPSLPSSSSSSSSSSLSSLSLTSTSTLSTPSQPVDYLLLEYLKSKSIDGKKPSFRVCIRALVAVLQSEEKSNHGQGYNRAKQLVLSTKQISMDTFALLQCALLSSLIQIEDYDNACKHLYIILNDKQIRYPVDINIIGNLFRILLLQYNDNKTNSTMLKAEMVKKLYELLLSLDILKYNSCMIHEYGAKAFMILGDIYNAVISIERIKVRNYLINNDIMELSNSVLIQLSSLSSTDINDNNLMNTLRFALFQPLGLLPVDSQLLKSCLSILASSSEHHDVVLRYCRNLQTKGVTIDDEIIQSLLFITFDTGGSVQDIMNILKISNPNDYKNKNMKATVTTIVDTANLVRDGLLLQSESFTATANDTEMVQKIGFIKQFAVNMVNIPMIVVDAINRLPNETLSNRLTMMSSINMSLRLLVRVLNKVGLSKEGWEILRTIFEYSEGRWIPDLKIIMTSLGDAEKRNNISFLKAIIQSGNLPENFVVVAFLASQNHNDIDRHEGLQLWNTMINKKFSNCLNNAVIRAAMELGFSVNYETGLKVCKDIIDLSFEIYGSFLRSELTRVLTNIFLNLQYISDDISQAPIDTMQYLLHLIDDSKASDDGEIDKQISVTYELVSSIINIDSLLIGGHISLKKADNSRSLLNVNWYDNADIKKVELLDFSKLHKYLETCRLLRSDTLYLISSLGTDWLNVVLKCYLKAGQPLPVIEAVDRVIDVVGVNNIDNLSRLFTPELLATTIFLSSSITYDDNSKGFQKCKKYYDISLSINQNRPTNSLSLALLVAANNYNDVDGAFAAMKDKLAISGNVKITARKVRALSKNALRNGKQVELAMFWEEMHKLYPFLRMQSVPSAELLSSLLVYKDSSSLMSWANIISDSEASLSPNQLKYFLSRYNTTEHANCLLELLPILSDISNRYLEPGMPGTKSMSLKQHVISLPLSMTFLTNMVISLLRQQRERDALQLLQCIHPLQWPYDDILCYLASNHKILDVLAVLQKFEEVNDNHMTLKESTARTVLTLRNDISISMDDLNSYKDRSRFFHITIEVDKTLVSKIREIIAKIMTNKFNDDKIESGITEMKEFDGDYDYISPSKMLGMLPSYSKQTSDLDTILSLLPDDNIDVLNNDRFVIDSNADDNIQENLMFLLADRENQRLQFDSSLFEKTTIIDDTMANFDDILSKNKNNLDKPPTSKWVDPESPENVMKFIDDVITLGRQKDQYFKKVSIKDSAISGGSIHVTNQKKYWKNHLRNNMRIANAESNQLDVDDVIIKELAKSILISAKNDLLLEYSSSSFLEEDNDPLFSSQSSSFTNSAIIELFQKKSAQFFNNYHQLALVVTETLFKLCERSNDLDLVGKLVESLYNNDQHELLNESLHSIGLVIQNGALQKRHRKVSQVYEHIQPVLMSWLKEQCTSTDNTNHKDIRFSILENTLVSTVIARKPDAANNALNVISMLLKVDYKIDRKHLLELFSSLVDDNDVDHSLQLFNIMLKINIHANNAVLEELITKLIRRQQLDLPVWMIAYLHKKQYLVSIRLYTEIITKLIERNDDDDNDKILRIIKDVKGLSLSNTTPRLLSELLLNNRN